MSKTKKERGEEITVVHTERETVDSSMRLRSIYNSKKLNFAEKAKGKRKGTRIRQIFNLHCVRDLYLSVEKRRRLYWIIEDSDYSLLDGTCLTCTEYQVQQREDYALPFHLSSNGKRNIVHVR